jgi:hypothetical protein
VARFYSNENIALQVVAELRRLGHDVLTSMDAGNANAAVPDSDVLAVAVAEGRILLSNNRRHFLHLHRHRTEDHAGIVLCTLTLTSPGRPSEFTRPLRLRLTCEICWSG